MLNAFKLTNYEKCASLKLVKLKYKTVEQVIEIFYIIGSSEKLGPSSLSCRSFKTLGNVFLNYAESIEF